MAKVVIPFMDRFEGPMLKGVKKWTSRTKKYGEPGDIFEAFGQTFHIDKVSQKPLSEVVEQYVEEGLTSREEAMKVWGQLHPRKGFVPTQLVWTHEFHIVIAFQQFDQASDPNLPCECGSSVCDECNPGWEFQNEEDDLEPEDFLY